jgi:serine protease Do
MAQKMKTTGWIGVELDDHPKSGLMEVTKVVPGSPAEAAGIRPGDVFVAADGTDISMSKPDALQKAKTEWKPGTKVVLTIRRDGVDRDVAVEMAPMPADMLARYIGEHMLEHAAMAAARK